ncbi:hypothetical protein P618_201049 [Holospora obtusa F1]|uniref:Biotin transporter n=1 Tax=Holospora obtusa F1 TaxID=1399147 RepID=W6TD15_HOLOB|nr:hypothetical protein [Holospora obtusa]ETZ06758.1 hypothetical protein P618_201049 [Holospora obtusa F1]
MKKIFKIILIYLKAVGIISCASWIQIPFAPLPWNFVYFSVISLAGIFCKEIALSIVLFWSILGVFDLNWICPISSAILSSPCGGYFWGIVPALCWASFSYEKSAWIKWVGALIILEACGALQCILLSPNLNIAKRYGLFALFPWNLVQSGLGIRCDKIVNRIAKKIFLFSKLSVVHKFFLSTQK